MSREGLRCALVLEKSDISIQSEDTEENEEERQSVRCNCL
jgi:hypothetical protein